MIMLKGNTIVLLSDRTVYWWTESESQPLYKQKICQLKMNEESKLNSILDLKGSQQKIVGLFYNMFCCFRPSFDCDNTACQNQCKRHPCERRTVYEKTHV